MMRSILVLALFFFGVVVSAEEFCGLKFPVAGNTVALTAAEYVSLKREKTPDDTSAPGYTGEHRFFVNPDNPRRFLVLKYADVDLGSEEARLRLKNAELAGIKSSYSGLIATIRSADFGDHNGFYIEYNLTASPQVFTRFEYYFIDPACALNTIFSVNPDSEKLSAQLKTVITPQLRLTEPVPPPTVSNKKSAFKIILATVIDLAVLAGIFKLFNYAIGRRSRKTQKNYILTRRILARFFDGFLAGIILRLFENFFLHVFSFDKLFTMTFLYVYLSGLVLLLSTWMVKKYGQTPGRLVFNIQVVDRVSENKLTIGRALLRDLPFYLIGLFTSFMVLKYPDTFMAVLSGQKPTSCGLCGPTFFIVWGLLMLFQPFDLFCALIRKDKRTIRDLISHAKIILRG